MSGSKRLAAVAGLVLAALLAPQIARADPDVAARAQTLFDDAVALLKQRNFTVACPKLAESFALDPAGGTAVDLAFCRENEGRLASALEANRNALRIADADGRDDRKAAATVNIARLEKLVGRIRLSAPEAKWRAEGWQVLLDARALAPENTGETFAVDSGTHVVTATAPNKKTFARSLSVTDGTTTELKIDELVAADDRLSITPVTITKPADSRPIFVLRDDVPRRNWGIGLGAGGLAVVGGGIVAAVAAASLHAQSNDDCPETGCSNDGISAEKQANGYAWTANVAIIGGAALIGVGTYLFFTAKHAKRVPAFTDAALGTFVFDLR